MYKQQPGFYGTTLTLGSSQHRYIHSTQSRRWIYRWKLYYPVIIRVFDILCTLTIKYFEMQIMHWLLKEVNLKTKITFNVHKSDIWYWVELETLKIGNQLMWLPTDLVVVLGSDIDHTQFNAIMSRRVVSRKTNSWF